MIEHEDSQSRSGQAASTQQRRPGHELNAARDRAGISLEDMASRLHLPPDHVEAIERDDYAHLPAAAFVRGYLRAYAKEVGMDGDQIVAEFDALCEGATEPDLVLSHAEPDPEVSRGPLVAILVLAAVAAIGAAAWWFQQEPVVELPVETDGYGESSGSGADEETPTQVTSTDSSGLDEESTADAGITDTGEPESAQTDSGSESGIDAADTTADTVMEQDTGSETVAGADGNDNAPAGDMDAEGAETELVVEADPASSDSVEGAESATGATEPEGPLETSSAEQAATRAAATGPDRVEIVVDGESWLEVYDSRGRRLVYTLYSGASPVVLNGWAPFDIFLGNSPAVIVEVDDTTIDQSAFVRSDNTARFLADSEGARRR